MLKVIH